MKLLPHSDISVNRKALRKACATAAKKGIRGGFYLMYGLLDQVFTINELAESRGTGKGQPRPGDENKPILDPERIGVLKGN